MSERVETIVLASGINRIPLYPGYTPGYKALIAYEGKPSIAYVLEALLAAPSVGNLCIEGPEAELREALAPLLPNPRLTFIPGGETFLDSMVVGLKHFATVPRVLFVAADIPLLTPQAVEEFLAGSAAARTDHAHNLWVSAVPRSCYRGAYKRFTKPFNHYRDIPLCHGNLFQADPALLTQPDLQERVRRLYSGRKNAILSSLALGWPIAVVYMLGVELLHLLTLRQMARFVSRRLGFGVVPVLVSRPEITIDVDEADDYAFVKARLAEKAVR